MDRRTVLAFVLIFLILIGSDFVMKRFVRPAGGGAPRPAPAEQAQPAPAPPVSDRTASQAYPVPLASGGVPGWKFVGDPAAEQRFAVDTPLYRVEFSSHGARVVSWTGKQFPGEGDLPVELIPQGAQASARGDDAVTFGGATIPLGDVAFHCAAPAVTMVGPQTGAASLTFSARTDGELEVRKTYTFDPASYTITMDVDVRAVGPLAGESARLLGQPISARFGWPQGIASTEHDDRVGQLAFKTFAKVGDELHSHNRRDLAKGVDRVTAQYTGSVRFALLQNKYFAVAGILPAGPEQVVEGTIALGGDQARDQLTWAIEAPLRAPPAGGDVIAASRLALYIGPQEPDRLRAFGVGLEKTMDMGWALFRPLAEAVLWVMDFMYRFIPNYGVVIILFSVITKLLFYPLTRTSTESMKKMQALQPKIQELQQKYKDNREKMSQEMMKMYQKEKVNPMAGCLPLLVQMPVFIALYQALAHTIALRNAPFFLWINDLSQPDSLFALPFALPLLGSHVSLLPILMSASMWAQTKLTPSASLGGQMALMNTLMPVIFLFMFYQMPSGLVLYWLVNNVMTIYQTWRIHTAAPRTGGVQTT